MENARRGQLVCAGVPRGSTFLTDATRAPAIERIDAGTRTAAHDRVVVEAPLQLRARGTPVATIMRTPGHDLELVRGLLHAESVAAGALAQDGDDAVEIDVPPAAF